MRLTSVKTILILLICALTTIHALSNNDGLYFYSHSYPTEKRTTLVLNNGEQIKVKNMFSLSFTMDLRGDEALFGNIFCINTNDGKHIDGIISVSSEGIAKPGLVIDNKQHYINHDIKGEKNINVNITLDTENNKIIYNYRNHKIIINTDLSHTKSASILFGMHRNDANYVDVAPINVRDVNITINNKEKFFWELRQHEKSISYDKISQAPATATNGHWILDDHINWKTKLTYKSKDKVQVIFNPTDNIFYIVDNKSVRSYSPETNKLQTIEVKGGYRAIMYSNYIGYNAIDKDLYTYNVKDNLVSHFNFNTGRWSNDRFIADEPGGINHSWAMLNDTVAYMFGGYGFYRYQNSLWRINPKTGDISKLNYSPQVAPRTGAASTIVDSKLYVFGGYGNEAGEQELPFHYYYDLICIDLNTLKAETVWSTDGEQQGTSFQLASEMIYNSEDSTFYVATTYKSGRIIKISLNKPGWTVVTENITDDLSYKDMTFNLYRSDKENKLYVVINRRLNNLEHHIKICSISLPLQDEDLIVNASNDRKDSNNRWLWWLLLIIPAAGIFIYYMRRTHSNNGKFTFVEKPETNTPAPPNVKTDTPETEMPANTSETAAENDKLEDNEKEPVKYYNPTGGYISILGKFVVKDSNGEDITALFTRRTRNLLLMLLLHSEKSSKGIEIHQLDETLWQEMDDESARNNRNVYMRKLRVLLEKVGTINVVNDKIHYHMNLGDNVFFDYHEALVMMNSMEYNDDNETTARTLELLFEGPLLPNYSYEWLDKFKADYSNTVISLLTRQLNNNLQNGNDSMALKIAETIIMHDPFSDKALATQCSILCRRHKKGIAKNVYDNFCKNYETCIGEKYHLNFTEVCK